MGCYGLQTQPIRVNTRDAKMAPTADMPVFLMPQIKLSDKERGIKSLVACNTYK